jgi:hypothetical protein
MTEHIAILSHKSVLDKILSGEKTIESRFSRVKGVPFGQISAGDTVYFKLSGGPVLGKAKVAAVEEHENLNPRRIEELARQYARELAISVDFLARKLESKFATLIFLVEVGPCDPWSYKQEGRSGWIILPENEAVTREQANAQPERSGATAGASEKFVDFQPINSEALERSGL